MTVLSLALEPFTQQLLFYDIKPAPAGSAVVYYGKRFESIDSSVGPEPWEFHVNLTLQGAVLQGLYGNTKRDPVHMPFSCPTGNCTWSSDVTTLAVCSDHADVKSSLQTQCWSEPDEYKCEYQLPKEGGSLYTRSRVDLSMKSYNQTNQSIAFAGYEHILSGFTFMRWRINDHNHGIEATEHIWYLCAQSYKTSVTNGHLSQNVTGTWKTGVYPQWYQPGEFVPMSESVADDYSILGPQIPGHSVPEIYTIGMTGYIALSMYLQNLTQGEVRYSQKATGHMARGQYLFSQDSMQPFFITDDISTIVRNIATRITTEFRQTPGLNITTSSDPDPRRGNLTAVGTAFSNQTLIQVRWPWISLFLALIIGNSVFLAGTIINSSRKTPEPWKNHSIALLAHGLDAQLTREFGEIERVSELNRAAKGTLLRLQDSKGSNF